MRTGYSAPNIIQLSRAAPSVARRQVAPRGDRLTALVLVRHGESKSKLAWLVSDTGIATKAVWIPKSMVIIEQPSDRGILVATMSQAFAEQKNLHPRFIDPELFNEATREALLDAARPASAITIAVIAARAQGSGRTLSRNRRRGAGQQHVAYRCCPNCPQTWGRQ